jgi:hypothetical protein
LGSGLNRCLSYFSSPNADHFFDWRNHNLAVATSSGTRTFDNSVQNLVNHVVTGEDRQQQLGMKVYPVLAPAIDFRMTPLPAEAEDFGDRETFNTGVGETLSYVAQILLPDHGIDFLHFGFSSASIWQVDWKLRYIKNR